jgi:hypothetical protein
VPKKKEFAIPNMANSNSKRERIGQAAAILNTILSSPEATSTLTGALNDSTTARSATIWHPVDRLYYSNFAIFNQSIRFIYFYSTFNLQES